MPTIVTPIVTANCLNSGLATKQDALKKCDGSPLLANTAVPTCSEFSAVSGNLSSVSANLSNVSGNLSSVSANLSNVSGNLSSVSSSLNTSNENVAAISNNLSNVSSALGSVASGASVASVSNNLSSVSANLNTTNIILNSLSSTLANKATFQDVVNGTDDEKILSAKDVYEAYSTGKQIPVNTTKPLNQLGYSLFIPTGTTTADNHYVIAHDLPNTQSASVSSSFYQNFTGQAKSFNDDILGGYGGIGINDVNNTASDIIMTGLGTNGLAIGWQGVTGQNVKGAGRTVGVRGINISQNTSESYAGFFTSYGEKTAGRAMGVYAQAANAPMNTGVVAVAISSTTNPSLRIAAKQTGAAVYAEGSSTLNYGLESYATGTSAGTNHGIYGYATAGFDNKGVEGFAVGATAGTNYGGKFVAQDADLNNWAIHGIGNGWFSGILTAQNFITSSDSRLKKEFKPVKNILNSVKIQQFTKTLPQPIFEQVTKEEEYSYPAFEDGKEVNKKGKRNVLSIREKVGKDGKQEFNNDKTVLEIGVIAQEVQAVYPEFVKKDERGYLTVDFNSIQFALIESLRQEIVALQARVTALEPKPKSTTTKATTTKAATTTTTTAK